MIIKNASVYTEENRFEEKDVYIAGEVFADENGKGVGKEVIIDAEQYAFFRGSIRFLFQDENTRKYGYKNSEGKIVIPPMYYDAEPFANGRAVVRDTINDSILKDGELDVTIYNRCYLLLLNLSTAGIIVTQIL